MSDPALKISTFGAAVLAIFGIDGAAVAGACAGALCSLAYSKPVLLEALLAIPSGTRLQRFAWLTLRVSGLAFTLAANVFVSSLLVSVLPHLPGLDWAGKVPPGAAAGLLAFVAQQLIPRALNAAGRWLDAKAAQ